MNFDQAISAIESKISDLEYEERPSSGSKDWRPSPPAEAAEEKDLVTEDDVRQMFANLKH